MVNCAGYRETHKYYAVKCLGLIKEFIHKVAKQFTKLQLIDEEKQIFELTFDQVIDIQKQLSKNKSFS